MRVPVVTSSYTISYLRPAVGSRLVARAQALHVGRSQAVCRCEVYDVAADDEKLCAVAQGTIMPLGDKAGDKPGADPGSPRRPATASD